MNMVRMVRIVGFCLVSVFMATSAQAVTGYWTNSNTTSWDTSGSWVDGIIPNGAGDIAYFTHDMTAARGVNITGTVVCGMIYVGDADGSHVFSISSTGTGVFNNAGSRAALTMTAPSSNLTVNTGRVVLESDLTITNLSAASLMTISSVIEGTGSVSVAGGPGVLLSGSNSFGGGVTLNSGVLRFGHNYAMGTGPMIFSGGTVDVSSTRTTSNNNPQTWNGDFAFLGSATWNMGAGAITLGGSQTLTVAASTLTVPGPIDDGANTYSLAKAGAGVLVLAGTNILDGGIVLNEGELAVNGPYALGLGPLVINGGLLNNATSSSISNANHNVQIWNADFTWPARSSLHLGTGVVTLADSILITNPYSIYGGILTVGGAIDDGAGSYGLTFDGINGGLALAGPNTFEGGISLNNGRLFINHAQALGTGPLTIYGGQIDNNSGSTVSNANNNAQYWNGDFSFYGRATLHMGTGAVALGSSIILSNLNNAMSVGGPIDDGASSYSLTKRGGGTLALGGENTYEGGTVLDAGALELNHPMALGLGLFTINGGNLSSTALAGFSNEYHNAQMWNGDFSLVGGKNVHLGTGAVTLARSCAIEVLYAGLTVGGVIDDGGNGYGITKGRANTLTLTGVNTYRGDTIVATGTLALAGAGSIENSATILVAASSTVSVIGRTDGTLTLGTNQYIRGNGTVRGVVTNTGTVAPGTSAGGLNVYGSYSQSGTLAIELGGTTPATEYDVLVVSNSATLGGTLTVSNINAFVPTVGNAFTVLTASAVSGTFATTNLPAGTWTVDYLAKAVVVTFQGASGDPELVVSPGSLGFGNVRVGETADLVFTVTNSGAAQLEGTATVSGVGFAVQSGSPFSIAADSSADVTIRFTPTETANYLGDVVFLSNGGGSTNAVSGVGYVQSIGTNTSMNLVGGQPTFGFSLVSGALYRVQASTNLLDGSAWQDVTGYLTNNYPGGSVPAFSETNAVTYPRRSYRVSSP